MLTTLKQFKSRTLVNNRDLSAIPMPAVSKGLVEFETNIGSLVYGSGAPVGALAEPESEALWFYLSNHAMAVIQRTFDPAEPLPAVYADVVRKYHHDLEVRVLRMYGYLMRICTRETRHSQSTSFLAKFPQLVDYYQYYRGSGGQSRAIQSVTKKTPDIPQGMYTKFLRAAFYEGKYSGGYGGAAWGQIADVLDQFVHGKITGEIMLDTAFTLCHNNGPIFNKGMLYAHHNTSALQELLDVQRAGMIPGLVCDVERYKNNSLPLASHYRSRQWVTTEMENYCKTMAQLSTDFSGRVEWNRLPELGAVFNHQHLITEYTKLHGAKPDPVAAMKAKKAAAEAQAAKASQWQITPGVFAKKFTPARVGT